MSGCGGRQLLGHASHNSVVPSASHAFFSNMPQVKILVGARVSVYSFVDGTRISRPKFRETEMDALAYALWLENHGASKQAEKYLGDYVQRNSSGIRH